MQKTDIRCSFCGKTSREVESIIAGPVAYICNLCVLSSVDILRNNAAAITTKKSKHKKFPSPPHIKKELDEFVGFAADAVRSIIAEGVEKAMTRFNRRAPGLNIEEA